MVEEKKVELNLVERMTLVNSLPTQGNVMQMKIISDIGNKLVLDEEGKVNEYEEYGAKVQDNKITYDAKKANSVYKEFSFTPVQFATIVNALKKLSEDKKLELKHISIYEKFIGEISE